MFMLRGKVKRWGSGLSSKAVLDLRLDDDGLSLYYASDEAEAKKIAAAHALTYTRESSHEWILLPDDCVHPLDPQPDPGDLPSPLRESHHLLKIKESDLKNLARAGCEHNALETFKQNSTVICEIAETLIPEYNLKVTDYWREKHQNWRSLNRKT